ncbi:MAG: hypothetical protein QNK37_16530 [Acidobacteriota bacterium]|nr:hypothetical protein [Acidobacteriota bacterium]
MFSKKTVRRFFWVVVFTAPLAAGIYRWLAPAPVYVAAFCTCGHPERYWWGTATTDTDQALREASEHNGLEGNHCATVELIR